MKADTLPGAAWVVLAFGCSFRSAIYELNWFSLLNMSVVLGGERLFERQLRRRSLTFAMKFLLGCSTDCAVAEAL